jgi:hypothetical protein
MYLLKLVVNYSISDYVDCGISGDEYHDHYAPLNGAN